MASVGVASVSFCQAGVIAVRKVLCAIALVDTGSLLLSLKGLINICVLFVECIVSSEHRVNVRTVDGWWVPLDIDRSENGEPRKECEHSNQQKRDDNEDNDFPEELDSGCHVQVLPQNVGGFRGCLHLDNVLE